LNSKEVERVAVQNLFSFLTKVTKVATDSLPAKVLKRRKKQGNEYQELAIIEKYILALLIKTNSSRVNRQLIWQSPKTILKIATCFIHTSLTIT